MRFEFLALADRVHRLPEAPVFVGHEFAVAGKPHERRAFPDGRVVLQVFLDLRRQDEIAAVDEPAVACRLSENSRTCDAAMSSRPKRAAGGTAVTVAMRPCALWKAASRVTSMSPTPSP